MTQTEPHVVIEIGELWPALRRAGRLFVETVLVPTALLYVLLHTAGLAAGLSAVLGWCALTVAFRWATGRHLPGTLLLCVGMLCGRAGLALVMSSALVYVLQPVVGSLFMALLFLGSAAAGRPITMRLARDFVALPAHMLHRPGVRRMFTQVALVWGGSRLVDAALTLTLLRFGLDAGLLSRGVFSGLLTGVTILACTGWGWRCLRRLPGISVHLRAPALSGNAPAT
ncbi:DUF3159 domain-containing protein [Phytohabitans suffuscus]|uniref:Intracellular septation protein A n=1 Tax=Phytohabitans suffuscus TaxID=624315 RepID=A0A6F8YZY7_9ACTN|nr:hypothetical protein [Phytohabitans suffuscus]BCB91750.1 hypothetical protein Psuf_090630 [Phytohabitans suffuscus]